MVGSLEKQSKAEAGGETISYHNSRLTLGNKGTKASHDLEQTTKKTKRRRRN